MCARCRAHLKRAIPALCPLCTVPIGNGFLCADCRTDSGIQQIVSVFHFKQKGIRELVHALKYENIRSVAPWMGRCMAAAWRLHGYGAHDIIMPIPLHASRLREREYNQALLLAGSIQRELGIGMQEDILARTKPTASQTELTSGERAKNVKGCFSLMVPEISHKNIVLVDDVFTTGATLREAAHTLHAGGAKNISALTFAHD